VEDEYFWKNVCLKNFDIEYLDKEGLNWFETATKLAKIRQNIRKSRAVVTTFGVEESRRIYTADSFIKGDNIITTWVVSSGRESFTSENADHYSIVNVRTRKAKDVSLAHDEAVTLIGDYVALAVWDCLRGNIEYSQVKLALNSESGGLNLDFTHELPLSKQTMYITANDDPNMKHLMVFVESRLEGVSEDQKGDLFLKVYDVNIDAVIKTYCIPGQVKNSMYRNEDPSLVFHSNQLDVLTKEGVLYRMDIDSPSEVAEQIQLPFKGPVMVRHKSRLYGVEKTSTLWMYDLDSKTTLKYESPRTGFIWNMTTHCGMLVVAADPIVFFFALSNTTTLEPLGGLLSDRHGQDEMISMQDGRLFMRGETSVKIVDFEHVNDEFEILLHTFNEAGEEIRSPLAIKAYQLMEKTKEFLRTEQISSCYYFMDADQRYGVIFGPKAEKTQKRLSFDTENLKKYSAVHDVPYMYYEMIEQEKLSQPRVEPEMNSTRYRRDGLFGAAVHFYEKWDGTRWVLSKPATWQIKQ
jgi:hypothetical protein